MQSNRGAQLLAERIGNLGIGRKEAAERLHISRQALHGWLEEGVLPGLAGANAAYHWLGIPQSAWGEPPEPKEETKQ